jgi:primosomal protein N' (replication factor Y)
MMKRFDGETQISILGPAPAPMEKKAGLFRWQLIFKSSQRSTLHHVLKQFIPMMQNHQPKGVRCFVEIDPYDWSA